MPRSKLTAFVKGRPYLWWYTKNYAHLSPESIVEGVLNYGDWDDVQKMITLMGKKRVARIFRAQTSPRRMRINYHPKTAHFFKLYFDRHAARHAHSHA